MQGKGKCHLPLQPIPKTNNKTKTNTKPRSFTQRTGHTQSARLGDFTALGEHLSALLFRSLGERLAQEVGARREGSHPLRGRHYRGIPISDRCRSLPGKLTGTTGKVWTGTPPG